MEVQTGYPALSFAKWGSGLCQSNWGEIIGMELVFFIVNALSRR
jgi:hypothetical protein